MNIAGCCNAKSRCATNTDKSSSGTERGIDIEDRKTADEKIREQETELRQILDLTPQHTGVFGPDGSPLYANHAALEYFGITLNQWRAREGLDLISFIQMTVNTLSAKERSDFSRGRPMNSKLGC